MKKYSLIAILLIAVIMFVGCSHNAEVSIYADESLNVSLSASNTENSNSKIVTENASSTQISTTETTTAQTITTKPKEREKSTTAKATTKPVEQKSTVHSTTKVQTTTKQQTTTKKQTTTTKHTTTKKVTTTAFEWDCKVDGHTSKTGQIGWVNSEAEATDKALEYIGNHDASGNFRVEECYMCGKFTAYITLN